MLNNQQNFQNKSGLGFGKRNKNKKLNKKSHCPKNKKHFGYINYLYCNQRENHIKDYCYKI